MTVLAGHGEKNLQFVVLLLQLVQSAVNLTHFVGQTSKFILLLDIVVGLAENFLLQIFNVSIRMS